MQKKSYYLAAVITSLIGSQSAMAASENDSHGMSVAVRIPVQCDVSANSFAIDQENGLAQGSLFESCNSNRGYQILASHRPLLAGENVTVRYGTSAEQNLDMSGLSAIAFRAGARHRAVPVAIRSDGLQTSLALSFSMTII